MALVAGMMAGLAACSDQLQTENTDPSDPTVFSPENGEIGLGVAKAGDEAITRATPYSQVRLLKNTLDSIIDHNVGVGVFGYYTGTNEFVSPTDETTLAKLFVNEKITFVADGKPWAHTNHRYWPTASHYTTFMSYAPYLDGDEKYDSNITYRSANNYSKTNPIVVGPQFEGGHYHQAADPDSLVHLMINDDGVLPAIRYVLPYHLASFPDILWGTQSNGPAYKDITKPDDNYVHWTMRHALAKEAPYLTSSIDLENVSTPFDIANESSTPTTFEKTIDDTTYTCYYTYKVKERKLVVEEFKWMDFYDKGTLLLLNAEPSTPNWVGLTPAGNNDDKLDTYDTPVNWARVPSPLVNKHISLNWDTYDQKYWQAWYIMDYVDSAKYTGCLVVPRYDSSDANKMEDYYSSDPLMTAHATFNIADGFKLSSSKWDTLTVTGVMETEDMIPMAGPNGEYYVMNLPQDHTVWAPKIQVKYRVMVYYEAVLHYKSNNSWWSTYTEDTSNSMGQNYEFYCLDGQKKANGTFNRPLVGGRNYVMKINLAGEYVTFNLDVQDWDVEEIEYNDFSEGVTIADGGEIEWEKSDDYGYEAIDTDNGILHLNSYTGKCTFFIQTPENATWTANLIGDASAFEFLDAEGNVLTGNPTGRTGEQGTIYIRAKDTDSDRENANKVILRIFVETSMGGDRYLVKTLGSSNFTEWTIIQDPNM